MATVHCEYCGNFLFLEVYLHPGLEKGKMMKMFERYKIYF